MCGPHSTVKTQPQASSTCDSSSQEFKAFHQSIRAARGATPVNKAALQAATSTGAAVQAAALISDVSAYFPARAPVAFTTTHVAAHSAPAPADTRAAAPAQHAGRKLMA